MPLWITRICHSPIGVRLRRRAIASTSAVDLTGYRPRRQYSQHVLQGEDSLATNRRNSAIIIADAAGGISPETLIAHIEPVEESRLSKDRFGVFLLTPGFAQWLLDDTIFLQKALRRAYSKIFTNSNDQTSTRVHALCAVVDKLPIPEPLRRNASLDDLVLDRAISPPLHDTGSDGLAYAALAHSDSLPSNLHLNDKDAAIIFVAPRQSNISGQYGETVRLPIANTVFQTGRPTTMVYSSWRSVPERQVFELESKKNITHHAVRMHTGSNAFRYASALAVPLVPLTDPRKVEAGMGNILRKVLGPSGKSMAASHELEQRVPQFFAARGEPSQTTQVWALVMPPLVSAFAIEQTGALLDRKGNAAAWNDDDIWKQLWNREKPAWSQLISGAMARGARLHRVLSGGGGWGKKAGLLSLDPNSSLDETASSDSITDAPKDLTSALSEVAKDGDYIQFFVSPPVRRDVVESPGKAGVEARGLDAYFDSEENLETWEWEFGTIPSTIDTIPANDTNTPSVEAHKIKVYRNCFGALTEKSLHVGRQYTSTAGHLHSTVCSSDVDVPYTRFCASTLPRSMAKNGKTDDSILIRNVHISKKRNDPPSQHKHHSGHASPPVAFRQLTLESAHESPRERSPMSLKMSPSSAESTRDHKRPLRITRVPTELQDAETKPSAKVETSQLRISRMRSSIVPSAYFTDKLRQTQNKISVLMFEYRSLMHRITRAKRQQIGYRPSGIAHANVQRDDLKGPTNIAPVTLARTKVARMPARDGTARGRTTSQSKQVRIRTIRTPLSIQRHLTSSRLDTPISRTPQQLVGARPRAVAAVRHVQSYALRRAIRLQAKRKRRLQQEELAREHEAKKNAGKKELEDIVKGWLEGSSGKQES